MRMRNLRYRVMAALLTAVLLLGLLAGCTQTTNGPKQDPAKGELEVWTFFDKNVPGAYYVFLWDTLAEQYGYEINVKTYSTEQLKDKLKVALVCNELPDIFLVWGGSYPDYLFDAGECMPVDDYISRVPFKEEYIQPYKDGVHYIIPCLSDGYEVVYGNQKLMAELEIKQIPETWEELEALVTQVTAYNEEHDTSYAALELGEKDSYLGEMLYGMIVNRINPYAYEKWQNGTIDFSAPVFLEAAQKVEWLVQNRAFPENYMEKGDAEAVRDFINKEAVLFPHQSTIIYHLIHNMGEKGFLVGQFPSCADAYDETYSQYLMDTNHSLTPGICINAKSEYKEDAASICLEFAKQVNETNVTEYGYQNLMDITYPETGDVAKPVSDLNEMIASAEKITPDWYSQLPQETGDSWQNLTKKLFAGELNAQEFIKEAQECVKIAR